MELKSSSLYPQEPATCPYFCNYPTVLKEKNMEKQKEYNLCYLLAKVRTT
jgi:hypothetical protein